jgi:hypothetical protein
MPSTQCVLEHCSSVLQGDPGLRPFELPDSEPSDPAIPPDAEPSDPAVPPDAVDVSVWVVPPFAIGASTGSLVATTLPAVPPEADLLESPPDPPPCPPLLELELLLPPPPPAPPAEPEPPFAEEDLEDVLLDVDVSFAAASVCSRVGVAEKQPADADAITHRIAGRNDVVLNIRKSQIEGARFGRGRYRARA